MFSFLKDKLKNAISSFKKTLEGEPPKKEQEKQEEPRKKEADKPQTKAKQAPSKPAPKDTSKEKPKQKGEAQEKKTKEQAEKPKETLKEERTTDPQTEKQISKQIPAEPRANIPEPEPKRSIFSKIKDKISGRKEQEKTTAIEKPLQELQAPQSAKVEEQGYIKSQTKPILEEKSKVAISGPQESEEKKGFFEKIAQAVTTKPLSDEKFEEIFWELEIGLLESNVAVEVIDKIKGDLRTRLVNTKIRIGKSEQIIQESLEQSIEDLFRTKGIGIIEAVMERRSHGNLPYIVCFFGVNGSGKTTSIAKLAHLLKKNSISCVIAAADTFRAAAIHQLEEHAKRIDVKVIKHDYGADPAAVAFDAVEHARSKGRDVVLIDTAGRQHSNINLVDEMKKIIRVVKPDLKVFVGDSLTGNDVVEQSKSFDAAVGIDAIILTKADVDEKGGAALSISYVTGKPIIYIGMGQSYDDLRPFDKDLIIKSLGLEA